MNDDIILSPFGAASEVHLGPAAQEQGSMRKLLKQLSLSVQDFNLEKEMVQLAFEAAQWQPDLADGERQAVLLLVLCSLIMQQQGSTRVPLRDEEGPARLTNIVKTLLRPRDQADNAGPSPDEIVKAMRTVVNEGKADRIIGREGEFKPFLFDGENLYHYRMLHLEKRLVDKLRAIIARGSGQFPEQVPVAGAPEPGRGQVLEEEQKQAIRQAGSSSFCIITGGPGTGKTTVIVSLLRMLLRQGIDPASIALAAPTGKAANRMGESVEAALETSDPVDRAVAAIPKPQTLHRLLGYSPGRDTFRHHRNNPLLQEVVIIDEASMVDLVLMERLLGAVRADGRLLLIGDAEQLPSVDAGAVFKDLVSVGGRYVARLEISHRMRQEGSGKQIYSAAQAIRKGSLDDVFGSVNGEPVTAERTEAASIRFSGVELHDPRAAKGGMVAFLNAWRDRFWAGEHAAELHRSVYPFTREGFVPDVLPALERIFAAAGRARVLGLTRAYSTGIDAVNRYFHERAVRSRPEGAAGDTEYLAGEPVMMQRNDYENRIFNGDQGIVLNVSEEGGRPFPGPFSGRARRTPLSAWTTSGRAWPMPTQSRSTKARVPSTSTWRSSCLTGRSRS